MPLILRRPLFVEDIKAIWTYIAADNEAAANRLLHELEERYRLLSERPQLGSRRFSRYPSMRLFPFRRYLIIYQSLDTGDGIELIRLLHTARDYRKFFDE
ncbi:MAG: type II toxin-antitoxin system RelE/ParE family toxin [Agrobacterium albertimagni]|jgi:toxin ParE1/3/4